MRLPVLLCLALLAAGLAGCGLVSTRTDTAAHYTGTVAGQPVDIIGREASTASTDVDVAAVVSAAMAGVRGDVGQLAAAVKAAPPPPAVPTAAEVAAAVVQAQPAPDPINAPAAGGIASAGLLGLLAWLKSREAARHRADADTAWDRLASNPAPI